MTLFPAPARTSSVAAMMHMILLRLLSMTLSLLVASVVIFVMLQAVPGDPAAFMLGLNAQPDTVAALRTELGLEGGLIQRYVAWVGGMVTGDFGTSYTYRVPVAGLVADRIVVSGPLAAYALILTLIIAIPAGVLAAARRNRVSDWGIMGFTQLGIAVPNFWFAMLLVAFFAVYLGWFSAGGFPGWSTPVQAIKALTLPAIALALPQASILARVLRGALIDTLDQDYIRTARAKGLSRRATVIRHALRNAAIPVLTILGLQFSFLLAGAIIIENVFFLPGLGRLIFQGITQRDLIVVQSVTMLLVFAVIAVTFAVEIAYTLADPRLRRRSAT
ncbi:peptide/nickel transport system permease protein [Jannaschia helgolandensis]|jgi:peptide/nickel transport system permease protein|uniref:Peptide/nickel transport system permease protein n=2 Tax=Jannaschia helgolandensis TaxID=188906 RepID=A0A1H7SGX3_9RHOB|nr:peptide/nickel transport system permease protein [Jannaschia helgolandensis]